jgi:hypothetical protein
MPIFGTLDPDTIADGLPVTGVLAEEDWESEQVRALTVSYEIDDTHRLELVPPALHPSIPPYCHVMVRTHASSPVGRFNLAELRLMSRAGSHYGGYTVGAIVDTGDAENFLRERYGWSARLGEVELTRRYHGAHARVALEGRTVLDMAITHPQPITPGDMLVTAGFHLARVGNEVRLIQTEPSYSIDVIQRGRPQVSRIDTEAFGEARVTLTTPIVATYFEGSFTLGRVRFLIDPMQPAAAGTIRVDEEEA